MQGRVAAIVVAVFLGGIAACAQPNPALAPGRALGDSVVCDTDCAAAWQRAQLWVAKHAAFKIQTANDVLIQTYGSTGSSAEADVTLTKEPLPGGKYKIEARLHCANIFGCVPNADDSRGALLYYVKTGADLLAADK